MATSALAVQNWFETTLSGGINASDTDIGLNSVPTGTEGYLIIEPDGTTTREVIYYTSKTSNSVVLTSAANGRGVDGTTAQSHSAGATVRMQITSGYWNALQDGTALAADSIDTPNVKDGAITAAKLSTSAITLGYAQITSNSTTTSGTFAVGSNTLGVSVTIPSGARRVKVTVYSVLLSASSTNTVAGAIFSGATVGALTNQLQQWNGGNSTSNQGMCLQWVSNIAPSAGTIAYTFAMLISGGNTATLTADANFPAFILVEAI